MAIRNIVTEEDPVLRKRSREIKEIDDRIKELAQDMIDTLNETSNGIGLAAPQIGVLKRIFIIDMREDENSEPIIFINPEIISKVGTFEHTEGCLSIPDIWGEIRRPAKVTVRATDLNGEEFTLTAKGLMAACVEHETDHLNGMLYVDRKKQQELGVNID